MEITTRVYQAKTVRIHGVNLIEVDIDLGFGTHVHRRLRIEGIGKAANQEEREKATHCLIVLLGGKRLVVQVESEKALAESVPMARVFLNERVFFDPPGMAIPFGLDKQALEVGQYMQHIAKTGYDLSVVKKHLNGKK